MSAHQEIIWGQIYGHHFILQHKYSEFKKKKKQNKQTKNKPHTHKNSQQQQQQKPNNRKVITKTWSSTTNTPFPQIPGWEKLSDKGACTANCRKFKQQEPDAKPYLLQL